MAHGPGRRLALAVVAAAMLYAAPASSASTLHTTPGGPTSGSCSVAVPCDIDYAIQTLASPGDEIVVGPGQYTVGSGITVATANLDIHGAPGVTRPVIIRSSSATVVSTITVNGAGEQFSDLDVRASGPNPNGAVAIADNAGATFDRMLMSANPPNNAVALQSAAGTVVTDSVLVATGSDTTAFTPLGSATLVNDTISGGVAARPSETVTLQNTIVQGGILTINAAIVDDHSNIDSESVFTGGSGTFTDTHRQMATPALTASFHEAPNSPTIDAGIADPRAPLDVDSEARGSGAANDIGADEYYAPGSVRYAAPDGVGVGNCAAPGAACSFAFAIATVAQSGDEVVVEPGDYTVTAPVGAGKPLDIHGAPGQRPVITGSTAGPLLQIFSGSTVSDLDLRNGKGTGLASGGGSTIDRVFSSSGGADFHGMELRAGDSLSDSVVWEHGGGHGAGVDLQLQGAGATATLRNVTAIADGTGNSSAVLLQGIGGSAPSPPTLDARNLIARGVPSGADVRVSANDPTDFATMKVANSDFDVTDTHSGNGTMTIDQSGGGNTSASPQFVDAAHGDFHELATSPTVNAGGAAVAPLDLDGFARDLSTAPDIGAFELVPLPDALTSPASDVGANGATLNGSVDPEGEATTLYFEYGPTSSYGLRTPDVDAGSGTTPVAASAVLSALASGATFHYRIVAVNAAGKTVGDDATFTTATPPVVDAGGAGGSGGGGGQASTPLPPVVTSPASPAETPDRTAPVLTAFSSTKKSFRVGHGPHFRFTLSEAGSSTLTFEQRQPGRRSGTKCVRPTKKNAKARRCTRLVRRGVLTVPGRSGANDVAFSGKIGGKALPVGIYRVTLVATDAAGNKSAPRSLTVKIVR